MIPSDCMCGGCKAMRKGHRAPDQDPYLAAVFSAVLLALFDDEARKIDAEAFACPRGRLFRAFIAGGMTRETMSGLRDAVCAAVTNLMAAYPDGLPPDYLPTLSELGLGILSVSNGEARKLGDNDD